MTNFPYNNTVPGANNDPSVDQPDMLENFQSIGGPSPTASGIIGIDHVGFNATDGGTHKQVTYSSNNVPGAQTNPASTAYTNTGTTTLVSENLFRNSLGKFPISAVKAYARLTTAINPSPNPYPATVTPTSQINLASNSVGLNVVGTTATYTFNLATGTTVADKMAVFFSFSDYRAITTDQYSYTISANQVFLTLKTTVSSVTPYIVTMLILQF